MKIDEVYKNLFVSGTIEDYEELKRNNIKVVVNVKSEEHDTISILSRMGIAYYYIPISDWGQPRRDQIKTLFEIWGNTNGNVLIHCAVGRGRSACMALAIMMHEGMSCNDAVKQIRKRRPIVTMLPNQIEKIRSELE